MTALNAKSDVVIKVLLIGDSGVGKSSLLLSFTADTFDEDIAATIGIDFRVKKVDVVDRASGLRKNVSLQIWDTAGQERFRTLTSSYYRGAHAVVLVYDVNDPQTFYGLSRWVEEANSYCRNDSSDDRVVYLLIGNKTDLCISEEDMAVSKSSAQQFAQQHHMLCAFTSAKTKVGVAQAFDEVARSAYDSVKEFERDAGSRSTDLREGHGRPASSAGGCC